MRRLVASLLATVTAAVASPALVLFAPGAPTEGEWSCAEQFGDAQLAGLDADQSDHARIIVAEGAARDIEPFGIAVALATAAQESTLRNLAYGDRDSLGLFQQRAPWGSAAQRLDPRTATGYFYDGGSGGQPGLLDIDGWQSMSLAEAAQAVQRSAYPDAYAKWEDDAWGWLAEATGDGDPSACPPPDLGENDPPPVVPDLEALRERAQDFADASAADRPDPYYGETSYYRWCARLAARIHGHANSGYPTAAAQWEAYQRAGVAVADGSPPPPGALLFYDTDPSGHIAVYLGDGLIVSNDVLDDLTGRRGGVYIVDASELTDGAWQLPYLGWAAPQYAS
ncbi:C40 family peptidase [Jiangella alkaliphila]|uniref:NlpC/P60 family protein n=1 Tax=Jiangella alkaliphila TaxID=419479 RepID=A0A1H2GD59_9ACTN|nr:hypothetical protein [Jiangella alkaliphila]SDU17449.1 hypothetical protein SAMN04488563_0428 [Jiangella alkaliphila]